MWTRLSWMTANAVAPEICTVIAMTQYLEARLVLQDIEKYCEKYNRTNYGWTMTQAFYYNMGGYVYHPRVGSDYAYSRQDGKPKTLTMEHLRAIVRLRLLRKITKPEDLINEYSKRNRLAKTIALVQALWLLIQTFARIKQCLPTSPLEITAVAYISVTLFRYGRLYLRPHYSKQIELIKVGVKPNSWFLWLHKPQDVGFSTELRNDEFHEAIESAPPEGDEASSIFSGWKHQLPNIMRPYHPREKMVIAWTWGAVAAVFGGLHLLAWNYRFPSPEERLLWRFSSVAIMVLPHAFLAWETILGCLAARQRQRRRHQQQRQSGNFVGVLLVLLYIAARLYNFVEVFLSLRSTPPRLYQEVQWPNWLPHF